MRLLYDRFPNALDRLAQTRKVARCCVARSPAGLYDLRRPDLARFARQFAPGWYVDTNLSYDNTRRLLLLAFKEAGLVFGQDWYVGRL